MVSSFPRVASQRSRGSISITKFEDWLIYFYKGTLRRKLFIQWGNCSLGFHLSLRILFYLFHLLYLLLKLKAILLEIGITNYFAIGD